MLFIVHKMCLQCEIEYKFLEDYLKSLDVA